MIGKYADKAPFVECDDCGEVIDGGDIPQGSANDLDLPKLIGFVKASGWQVFGANDGDDDPDQEADDFGHLCPDCKVEEDDRRREVESDECATGDEDE